MSRSFSYIYAGASAARTHAVSREAIGVYSVVEGIFWRQAASHREKEVLQL